jgi:hypothetical protein
LLRGWFSSQTCDAVYTAIPKRLLLLLLLLQIDPNATPIHEVEDITSLTADTSTTGTQWGTGGMVTKLTAARIATGGEGGVRGWGWG